MKHLPYPKYKNSSVDWIGEIPQSWAIEKLKYAANIFASNVDKKTIEGQSLVNLCNYTDVYYNEMIESEMDFMVASATDEQIDKFSLKKNDVIITKDSETPDDIGIAAYVLEDIPGVICGYHLSMIRPKNSNSGAFIKRLFDSHYVKNKFETLANGVTRYGLGSYVIKNLHIPLPPYEEQKDIVNFLDHETAKIDELIQKQQRLIELIIEKRISCITNAVTGGFNKKGKFKKTGIDWLNILPDHWLFRKLSSLTSKIGDGLHGTPEYVDLSNIHFINGTNLREGSIFITESTRCINSLEAQKYKIELNESTDLMSINGTIGNLALYKGESIVLGKSAAYINAGDLLSREYLYYYLQSSPISHFYDLSVTGSTISNLSLETIRNTYIALPPMDEQVEIVKYLTSRLAKIDELLVRSSRSIELLKEHRATLISAAVTGKIDVRESV